MRKKLLAVLILLSSVGCSSPQEKFSRKIDEAAAVPAATDIKAAKASYDSANKIVRWLEAHPEDSSPEVLDKAKKLRERRVAEGGKLVGDKISTVFGLGIGSIRFDSLGSTIKSLGDAILGTNDPKMKQFVGDSIGITDDDIKKIRATWP